MKEIPSDTFFCSHHLKNEPQMPQNKNSQRSFIHKIKILNALLFKIINN